MAVDYAHTYHRRRENQCHLADTRASRRRTPPLHYGRSTKINVSPAKALWLGGVCLSVGFLSLCGYFPANSIHHVEVKTSKQRTTEAATSDNIPSQKAVDSKAAVPTRDGKIHFTFYSKLAHYVAVPIPHYHAAPAAPNNGKGPAAHYLIQVAAFSHPKPATRLKHRLSRAGFHPHVIPGTNKGQVWYEVRIGPDTNSRVKTALAHLGKMHLNGLVLRARSK